MALRRDAGGDCIVRHHSAGGFVVWCRIAGVRTALLLADDCMALPRVVGGHIVRHHAAGSLVVGGGHVADIRTTGGHVAGRRVAGSRAVGG
mmetsp:Transcript_26064/g.60524  ORF Transcript_26064/g.60524 Transcript_26064/m.60524 type:complete len:91 (-) Transcript_26064:1058-1330(-)